MEFQLSYFKYKRWCCESATRRMPASLANSAGATGLEKVSFQSNHKERQCKECSNYCTTALISHTSKVMLKILQARLQQSTVCEPWTSRCSSCKPEEPEEPEIKLSTSVGSSKKQENTRRKNLLLLYWLYQGLWKITGNCGKFLKRWEYQTSLPASWEICMQIKKQQLKLDMEP